MAKIPDNIIETIRKLVEEAGKNEIHITQAILFGSYAQGTNHEFSDIDVALVSEDFEGTRFFDNVKLMNTVLNVNSNIETHPYRPEDFTKDNPFVEEILQYGVRIV
ncbi:nucleotidyltransferase domain-containing protein [Bacteroidota bacterium]